jgi:hypothetical protein
MSLLGNAPGTWPKRQLLHMTQRERKKVEALFAELKNQIGLLRCAYAG